MFDPGPRGSRTHPFHGTFSTRIEHKSKTNRGFTVKYNCTLLVYFEEFGDIVDAIHREKQLKKYRREWKKELIGELNPEWKDLSEGWYDRREFGLHAKLNSARAKK